MLYLGLGTDLGHVGVKEQLQIIMDQTLTDRVDVGQSISCCLEFSFMFLYLPFYLISFDMASAC